MSSWHERHEAVQQAIGRLMDRGMRLTLVAHSLIESYSVLTRLPAPYRLSPRDARALLERNFERAAALRALRASEHWELVRAVADQRVAGGRAYDALIAKTAAKLAPCTLLTLNPRHFAQWDGRGMTIREP